MPLFKPGTGIFADVAFSPDGSRILTYTSGGTARIWDGTTYQPLFAVSDEMSSVKYGTRDVHGREPLG